LALNQAENLVLNGREISFDLKARALQYLKTHGIILSYNKQSNLETQAIFTIPFHVALNKLNK